MRWEDIEDEEIRRMRYENSKPVCACCGEHILDVGYHIGSDWYCEDCMEDYKVFLD